MVIMKAKADTQNQAEQTTALQIEAKSGRLARYPAFSLQSSIGNQAMQRLFRPPEDSSEKEADRVADQVMRMPERQIKSADASDRSNSADPKNEAPRERLQTKLAQGSAGKNIAAPQIVHETLRSSGQPLDRTTRGFMEQRFGHDFSQVRVHTDAKAAESARAIHALGYTVGPHVVFGENQYSPETTDGRRLLAHELTHVVQQSKSTVEAEVTPGQLHVSATNDTAVARFPSPVSFGTYKPGLSFMPPVIKEGYDGQTYTAIKNGWAMSSWERRWRIYDAEDKLLYDSSYTWPHPTLYIPKDVVAKGKAGGKTKPWSVWHEVTETLAPFGGSNPDNFPYTYMKFYVYETWNDFMADPDANLSNVKQGEKSGAAAGKPTLPESSVVKGAGSVIDYGSVVAMHEAYLRNIYDQSAKGITETAKELTSKGLPQGDAARWANEARNALKDRIRTDGNPILKKVFEARNLEKYGNKLGPSYENLFQKYAKQGLSPEEINKKIIGSSGKANIKVNRWGGRLRIAGKIMLFIDIALAGVRVYLAPEGEKTKVALEEIARIGGALVMGAVGAEAGAAAGAAVGALFAGVGAVPGAVIGGIIGSIGGAIFGGWLGQTAVEKLYEMFPPSDCVFEGDFKQEDQ
jgi:hypothetical protein